MMLKLLWGLLCLNFLLLSPARAQIQFAKQGEYSVQSSPYQVVTGDFDNDTHVDFASINRNSNSVTIYRNTGEGFVLDTTYTVGSSPASACVADFTCDGVLDIAVANSGDNTITLLRGGSVGTGTFTPDSPSIGTITTPYHIVSGDINHDNKPDLIVAGYWYGGIKVHYGDGTGHFPTAFSTGTGPQPSGVCVEDLNGDGWDDIAVAHNYQVPAGHLGYITVALNDQHGDFTYGAYTAGREPIYVSSGDYNGDGDPDLVTGNTVDGTLSFFFGNGDGTFQSQQVLPVGGRLQGVASVYLNGDGHLDLVVSVAGAAPKMAIFQGDGTGAFVRQQDIPLLGDPVLAGIDHFNDDGRKDIAVAGVQTGMVEVFLQVASDTTAPTVDAVASPIANGAGWNNADVTVTLNAVDNVGGSGVQAIAYRFGSSGAFTTAPGATVSVPVTAEGTTLLQFYATDNAGNFPKDGNGGPLPTTYTVRLDKTAPGTIAQMSAAGTKVQVTLTPTDALSGIAQTYYRVGGATSPSLYTGPIQVTAGASVEFWSVDNAGNEELPHPSRQALLTVVIHLRNSAGSALAGGKVQYYSGGWKDAGTTGPDGAVSVELAPNTYTFSVTYGGGRVQKSQNIAANPDVIFATTRVTVRLQDSMGNPLSGATAQYYASGWKDIGATSLDGAVSVEILPNTYTFSVTYGGGRVQKSQNIAANPDVIFATTRVTVRLQDSGGNPLSGATAQYYASGWKDIGATGLDGAVSVEILPNSYTFSIAYGGGRVQKSQDIAANPEVVFATTRVHSASGACTQYYAGGWRPFTNDMELLPTSYTFRFNDGTANTVYAVSGNVFNIH